MTLETCDWLKWGALLHVVNNSAYGSDLGYSFFFFRFFPPQAGEQTQTFSHTHAAAHRQTWRYAVCLQTMHIHSCMQRYALTHLSKSAHPEQYGLIPL